MEKSIVGVREFMKNVSDNELKFIFETWGLPEWININIPKAMDASKHNRDFSKEIPNDGLKIQDNESKFYVMASSVSDYVDKYWRESRDNKLNHYEIILPYSRQKLRLTLSGKTPRPEFTQIMHKFVTFIENNYPIGSSTSHETIYNDQRDEYDIIISEFYVDNVDQIKKIIMEFGDTLDDNLQTYVAENIFKYGKNLRKPTILSKHHISSSKTSLMNFIDDGDIETHQTEIYRIVGDSFYTELPMYNRVCHNKNTSGIIYLLQEREFFNSDDPVYKIGRTSQKGLKRFDSYPKNSILYRIHSSEDIINDERQIKELFDSNFKQCTNVGREYYEGDIHFMLELLDDYFDDDNQCLEGEYYKCAAKSTLSVKEINAELSKSLNDTDIIVLFVKHIINTKPKWYKENDLVPFSTIQNVFETLYDRPMRGQTLSRYLGKYIKDYSKAIRICGEKTTCWLLKDISDIKLD